MKSIIWLDDMLDHPQNYLAGARQCFAANNYELIETPTIAAFFDALQKHALSPENIAALILDVMLTHKVENKTWEEYGLPTAFAQLQFRPLRAGVQLLEILISADWDDFRPEYMNCYRDHPILILTAYGGIDQQLFENIHLGRRKSVRPAVVKDEGGYINGLKDFLIKLQS